MAGTPNVGTLVGAAIRPINTADLISTAYANEIKGGIHGYATLAERDSIIIQRRQWGMLVVVYDDPTPSNNKTYQLVQQLEKAVKYDQIILEYRNPESVWIHTGYKPQGNRSMAFTMVNDSTYKRDAKGAPAGFFLLDTIPPKAKKV